MDEPSSLKDTVERLDRRADEFARGDQFSYSIFDGAEEEILGGIGLHPKDDAGCLEMGYWLRVSAVGRGFATEAARALAAEALKLDEVDRVQIDCDPANQRSRLIPERLGFDLIELREANKQKPTGEPRDTVVYELRDIERLRTDPSHVRRHR